MEKGALIRGNVIVINRGVYERDTSLQTISAVVLKKKRLRLYR